MRISDWISDVCSSDLIASSNFFSRLTHRHPGRAVWLVFNVLIALMLMQGGIQNVVERVLALYSNFAVAWFGAVIADLMVNKPLRSEEHTSELQSLMRISYAVFCLKKKKYTATYTKSHATTLKAKRKKKIA